jgi:hypothetical protein
VEGSLYGVSMSESLHFHFFSGNFTVNDCLTMLLFLDYLSITRRSMDVCSR